MNFKIKANYSPAGDQAKVIDSIANSLELGHQYQTILGATGTGKTYVMAKIIEKLNIPSLVISHNKTLAAQLYREFQQFFPDNAVEYFVSYYDYYQPEAYVAKKDLYIEKDSSINDEIDKLRLRATSALMERKDVIIVASVSCIYGLGSKDDYKKMHLNLHLREELTRDHLLKRLVDMQYARNDNVLSRGTFRVRGDVIDICPSYATDVGYRIELFGDEIESLSEINILNNQVTRKMKNIFIHAAKHFVMPQTKIDQAVNAIERELEKRCEFFSKQEKLLEKERLYTRVKYDLELLVATGFCPGIENYSAPLTGRKEGAPPDTLIDYFPGGFITFIDESHVSLPQIRGMYNGDRSRKQSLVEHGFRLPSALDNRPLYIEEFWKKVGRTVFVSATPGDKEMEISSLVDELIIRPTGLVDPEIEVRQTEGQIDHLLGEIRREVDKGLRVLVTTLTKKMSEDLTNFLLSHGVKVKYLHSDIETIDRVEIIKSLRMGEIDVIVGINLLREGLDLPEVSLVTIFDADKVGFLRSKRSLIQIIGRAARNVEGRVIMYADKLTEAMTECLEENNRRRDKQIAYNLKHNIIPKTIIKPVNDILVRSKDQEEDDSTQLKLPKSKKKQRQFLKELEFGMNQAAEALEFEKAIALRDKINELKTLAKI